MLVTRADDATLAAAAGVDVAAVTRIDAAPMVAREDDDAAQPHSLLPEALPDDGPVARRSVLRVEVARVDDAMDKVAALIVTRARLARIVAALAERGVDTRELVAALSDNARQLRDLRASMLRVRMVAVAEAFERLPLLVRGLCRATGKSARLEIDAGNAEIDKAVAERLLPAIVHLLRNAVDHGIESPDERVRRGKPAVGAVRIACVSRSNRQITITISDDGRGIDPAAVARKVGRDVAQSTSALLDALCEPGLSTRDRVTETSGRGMGMDIVKRVAVDQLGGELALETTYGVGTVFTLRVPLTIAIVDAFTVQCAAHRFVVPVSHVDEIVDVASATLLPTPGGARRGGLIAGLLERRGEAIPFVPLAAALAFDARSSRSVHALVVRRGADAVAFGLDRVVGQQEAVVRPLLDPLVQVPGVAGSTDLGDGRATLVLDLASLCATLARERAA
jgi:two-component system chemotaxis sensor kinase CheA